MGIAASIGVDGGAKGAMPPPKCLKNKVILCFERRFSKQNSVIRLKSNSLPPQIFWPPPKFWAGYATDCKCTVLSHLDQNIGLNKHKLSLLVNDNLAECNVSQEKMQLSTMALWAQKKLSSVALGMKSLFVGHRFLKQAKTRGSD